MLDFKLGAGSRGPRCARRWFRIGTEGVWTETEAVGARRSALRGGAGDAGADSLVPTTEKSTGDVEIWAMIDANQGTADRFGLAIDLVDGRGYVFLASAAADAGSSASKSKAPCTLKSISAKGGSLKLTILRDNVPLVSKSTPVEPGPLSFRAKREAGQFVFQVNSQPPLEFEDVLPRGLERTGYFGIQCPEDVGIVRLQAFRQSAPAQPTILEAGDELFASGKFEGALTLYRHAAIDSTQAEVALSARYKQALCLERSGLGVAAQTASGCDRGRRPQEPLDPDGHARVLAAAGQGTKQARE